MNCERKDGDEMCNFTSVDENRFFSEMKYVVFVQTTLQRLAWIAKRLEMEMLITLGHMYMQKLGDVCSNAITSLV